MDFTVKTEDGSFILRFNNNPTVLQIKNKIEESVNIPISKQVLTFGDLTPNDDDHIILRLFGNVIEMAVKSDDDDDEENQSSSKKLKTISQDEDGDGDEVQVQVQVQDRRIKVTAAWEIRMDMGKKDTSTIHDLKKKIGGKEDVPMDLISVFIDGIEVLDEKKFISEISVDSDMEVRIGVSPDMTVKIVKPLTVTLVYRFRVNDVVTVGEEKLVVGGCDAVSTLRAKMEEKKIAIPIDSFFIYNSSVMEEEERSFLWYGLKDGDTIQEFEGDYRCI